MQPKLDTTVSSEHKSDDKKYRIKNAVHEEDISDEKVALKKALNSADHML
jgi:hypothetical protein